MVMLLLAAFFAVASTASSAAAANWTVVPKTDCDGGDVKTHLPCAAHPPHTSPPVPELKACCLSLGPTCGGFNTHGVMKLVGCRQHEIAEPTVDLYILDLPPQPPPPPPPPPAPVCSKPAAAKLSALPLFHVIHGAEPHGPALCESNSSNAVVLKAQCGATKGCAAFTIGSGGGEPGDLPPHDCRGSRLYSASSLSNISTMAKSGVDLFMLGPAPADTLSTVTPKPKMQRFPAARSTAAVTVTIDRSSFTIRAAAGSPTNNVLSDALRRFATEAFAGAERRADRAASMASGACTSLEITLTNSSDVLELGVDESYNLTIQAGVSELRAATVWGAMYGLETFSQTLVSGQGGDDAFFADAQTISDAPRYKYRGLMLDTARHFLPLEMLFAVVDGMAVEKLNILHWHAVDDQSFPLEVRSLPRLAPAAQFGPKHTYSVENITTLVAYAKSRGIRTMLEIDTPGHCQVLELAYPELGLIAECPGTTCWPPLDVSKNSTMEFVRTIWRDLAPLFPDSSVFIGGDECHTTCWADNPDIAAWARSQNLTVTAAVESVGGEGTVFGWYIDQMVETVHGELGKRPNMWSPLHWNPASPPEKLVSSNAVLNLWTGDLKALAYNMTKTGMNDVVTSVGWYLPASAYTVDPASYCESNQTQPYYCSDEQRERIVGGEACMWGEGTDKTNFFANVWPDLTMVAEKLWSGPSPEGGLDLLDGRKRRLRQHRCRLVSRGVPMPGVGSEIYAPDASHASFSTWRESQWCPGDESWGAGSGNGVTAPGAVERAAAEGEHWAAEALAAGAMARARRVGTPFDL